MFAFIRKLLGMGPAVNYRELLAQGAQIIDVRTPAEFKGGHIKGSVNIPLQLLETQSGKIKKDKPVITCCASGMRSAQARRILAAKGYPAVYNGGGWMNLQFKIN